MSRVKSLDGFRGVAILLVLAAHLFGGVAPQFHPFASWTSTWVVGGGFVGVQMFFVLSGYLITGILLRELDARGGLNLIRFWGRRIRRLYPALVAVTAFFAGYVLLARSAVWMSPETHIVAVGTPTVADARGQVLGALTYTTNLHVFAPWGWLGHFWSLAVEEQFYLVWPVVLLAAWTIARRSAVLAIAVVGIVVTVVARHTAGLSAEDVYEGLRWDALLLGCAVAVVVPRPVRFRGQAVIGIAGFAVLAVFTVRSFDGAPESYTVAALASGAALVAAFRWSWLAHPVLRYFGRISYSLYLWHVLILRFAWPGFVSLPVSIAAADLSYRYIERRFWTPHTETAQGSGPAVESGDIGREHGAVSTA